MATFSLNGKQVEAPEGMNLIEAAAINGVTIPHYCYHPGLSVSGNCRMCLCEVEGARGPQIACAQTVRDGLVVKTDTPAVEKMRKGVQEFLLLNHPIDCPICDQAGECRLQDYYMDYGKYDNRSDVTKVQKLKAVDVGPLVVLDQERCILCSRCVRFCEEITETHELVITGRGDHNKIETFPGKQLDNKYSVNVVDLCPVGALTSKDFRFKMRVWFLKSVKSVCTGCARGCNTHLDQKDGHVYRYRPRQNMAVNTYWMCDEGRLSYKAINDNRLAEVTVNGVKTAFGAAVRQMTSLLSLAREKNAVVAIGSPFSSVEDNFMLKTFADRLLGGAKVYGYNATPDGFQDELLIRADKTPNRAGVTYVGLDAGRDALLAALKGGAQFAVVMNNDLAADAELAAALKAVPTVLYLGTHQDETAKLANFVFPVATHAEKYGSFINFQGRLQRFYLAFEGPGDVVSEMEFLSKLGAQLDPNFRYDDVEEIWADLRAAHPELGDIGWYKLGDEGFAIPSLSREAVTAER